MTKNPAIRVYHDGSCPFCRWTQQLVERRDRDRRLEFRDYQEHASETPFTPDELSRAMHVRTPDGRWHSGFFGWLQILQALPRWRWLAHVLGVPPLRWLGPPVYRVIAANRYRVPPFVLRLLGAPPPCAQACDVQPR